MNVLLVDTLIYSGELPIIDCGGYDVIVSIQWLWLRFVTKEKEEKTGVE